ncbi:ATP-NAD kinase family protein [Georgenia daeguensis]|uniref:ATP-NAD kinase family protein n=1 Tax=Georgenia daeguensis TaxID=908355 RepID=UPI0031E942DB
MVNPVAGIGGPVALKGSDGPDVQRLAGARGSRPRAHERAVRALAHVAAARPGTTVLTVGGAMGEAAVAAAGLVPRVVGAGAPPGRSTGVDTTAGVRAMAAAGADLVLFVGGDGTARDVCAGAGEVPVLGVPAGVKMYSGCFAVSPAAAGALALAWLAGPVRTEEREVLDVDEEQVRTGRVEPHLFGLVEVPVLDGRTQARKAPTPASSRAAVEAAARGAVRAMQPDVSYLLGPGGTTAEVARILGVPFTPLGVDVVRDGRLVVRDATEQQLLDVVAAGPARAVVTVIGGQGFLLGRGNQQISAAVLARMGPDPLLVVATQEKLTGLAGRPLLVDTGDRAVDGRLAGHVRIVTGPSTTSFYPVTAPENEGAAPCD